MSQKALLSTVAYRAVHTSIPEALLSMVTYRPVYSLQIPAFGNPSVKSVLCSILLGFFTKHPGKHWNNFLEEHEEKRSLVVVLS